MQLNVAHAQVSEGGSTLHTYKSANAAQVGEGGSTVHTHKLAESSESNSRQRKAAKAIQVSKIMKKSEAAASR
jgi:hypothetical protein